MHRFTLSIIFLFIVLSPYSLYATSSEVESESVHRGICDASGVVALDEKRFVVADDELNLLSIFSIGKSGAAEYSLEVSEFLDVVKKSKKERAKSNKVKEVDIEGAARIGDRIYWISSHGRKKTGKKAKERMRVFATSIVRAGDKITLEPFGIPYNRFLEDLLKDERYTPFKLAEAASRSPKSSGGLNVESITNGADGSLFIGLRGPLIKNNALLVTLLNPEDVINGKQPRFGDPITLNLGSRGIRGLASMHGRYLIVGNDPEGDEHRPAIYSWDGVSDTPEPLLDVPLHDFNPEAIAIFPDKEGGKILLLSDDGSRLIGRGRCKDLENLKSRRFRSFVMRYPTLSFYEDEHSGRSGIEN